MRAGPQRWLALAELLLALLSMAAYLVAIWIALGALFAGDYDRAGAWWGLAILNLLLWRWYVERRWR